MSKRLLVTLTLFLLVPALHVAAQSLPDADELRSLAEQLGREHGSSDVHTCADGQHALVAVEVPGSTDDEFPFVVLYVYDRLAGEGFAHRGVAHGLYFREKERRDRGLAKAMSQGTGGILKKSENVIRDLEPNVEGALLVEMTGHVHEIVGGLGAGTPVKKLFWVVSEGAKAISLRDGQTKAEVTYGVLLERIGSVHVETSSLMKETDDMLLRVRGPSSWAETTVSLGDSGITFLEVLKTAEEYDDAWETFKLTMGAQQMAHIQMGDLNAIKDYGKFFQVARCQQLLTFGIEVGPSVLKMAFSDEKCEIMRVLLIQAFYHAHAARDIAHMCEEDLAAFRRSPTPESAHKLATNVSLATIDIEMALRLQAAVIEINRTGDLGGELLAWIHENVLTEPGAIDRNIDALEAMADAFAESRAKLTNATAPHMLKLAHSVREVRPLPWRPEVGKIIATAEPLVLERGTWRTRLHGVALAADGLPLEGVEVTIEDSVNETVIEGGATDARGEFSRELECRSAEPGLYTFVVSAVGVAPVAIVVSNPADVSVHTSAGVITAPIGPWEEVVAASGGPAGFAFTHRHRSSLLGRAPLSDMLAAVRATGSAQAAFWTQESLDPTIEIDVDTIRVFGVGPASGVDSGKAKQSVETQLVSGILTGKRGAIANMVREALDGFPGSNPDAAAMSDLLDDPSSAVVAFAVDPYSGLCGWPDDLYRCKPGRVDLWQERTATGSMAACAAIQFEDSPRVAGLCVLPLEQPLPPEPPTSQGILDVVFVIDQTGSMADDIATVKQSSAQIIDSLTKHCDTNNISLQVGLVTYGDNVADAKSGWLNAWPLTGDEQAIQDAIDAIEVTGGGDYAEDLYAALMCAMDARADGNGQAVAMGWRHGAAKVAIPMCDGPPHDPDFEGRTLDDVARRAEELDPVHVYPLLTPRQGSSWTDPAVAAMGRLASATDGRTVRVKGAGQLPQAIVATVKLAIRRHRAEVWRKNNPPYLLYATIILMGAAAMVAIFSVVLKGVGRAQSAATGAGGSGSGRSSGSSRGRSTRWRQ
ncbi:MAG: VWA domain-containing protein [bacterium]|nr:VWA domain-containing protein [bacterium]